MWEMFFVMAVCLCLAFSIHVVVIKTLFGHQDPEFCNDYPGCGDKVCAELISQKTLRTINISHNTKGWETRDDDHQPLAYVKTHTTPVTKTSPKRPLADGRQPYSATEQP